MLFGVEAPKIIVNLETTQDEVALDYSVILKDEPELDTYGVKAVRTGKQVFTNAGKHWIFQVKIHLWKYADPKAKYLELKSYEGTKVYLYRHADGEPILDLDRDPQIFIIQSINETYTDEYNLYDYLIMTIRSVDKINDNLLFRRVDHIYESFGNNVYNTDLLETYEYPTGSFVIQNERLEVAGEYVDSGSDNFAYQQFRTKHKSEAGYGIDVYASITKLSFLYNTTARIIVGIFSDGGNYAGVGIGWSFYNSYKTYYRINNAPQVSTDLPTYTDNVGRYVRTIYNATIERVSFYILTNGEWVLVGVVDTPGWCRKKFYVGIFVGASNINSNVFGVDNLTISYISEKFV